MAQAERPPPLALIAARLSDIAATVGQEAQAATQLTRQAAEQARDAASLAAELDATAAAMQASVMAQVELLAVTRKAAADGLPVVDALTAVADRIGAMTALIDDVAKRGRMLALNARIEGARAGEAGRGFSVVATEMSALAAQTREATAEIDQDAAVIGDHVEAARDVFRRSYKTVDRHSRAADAIVAAADRQHAAAAQVARLSQSNAEQIDDAVTIIGRVASAAQAVDLLARQLTRASNRAT